LLYRIEPPSFSRSTRQAWHGAISGHSARLITNALASRHEYYGHGYYASGPVAAAAALSPEQQTEREKEIADQMRRIKGGVTRCIIAYCDFNAR
jgi:hypothetical protein